ncbi:CCA tRNA nucleotidyltransferase [Christensenellaceae bacterium OttesenSCG-928-M15]|nr:CCA tRNA nucleotidyltransferase [Christensenellaceae bacterium OttesenSCG-928-M15]
MMESNKNIPEELFLLAREFQEESTTLYAVGGLIRNALLGIPPSDMDICSDMTPDGVKALCDQRGHGCIMKAPEFGTVEVHIHGVHFEHTTFRGETYSEGGHHKPSSVRLGAALEADAFRRDFTCNALYLDILNDEIVDPTGGQKDIEKKLIRTTSGDPHRILRDDGLRILRLVRFACELGFDIDKKTFRAAQECVQGLKDIAWERKRDELMKILMSDERYHVLTAGLPSTVLRGLTLLHELGALSYVLPELLEGDGVRQRSRYHAYDVLGHNFHACAASDADPVLRLGALLHDVGKPGALREKGLPLDTGGEDEAFRALLKKGDTPMLGHDHIGAKMAKMMLERLRFPKKTVEEVVFLIDNHMYDLNGKAKQSTLRTRFAAFGYERSLRLCAIREADILGSGRAYAFTMDSWRDVLSKMKLEGAPFSIRELRCTGADVMRWRNIAPGREVGALMEKLFLHCARHPRDNTKERLEKIVKGL